MAAPVWLAVSFMNFCAVFAVVLVMSYACDLPYIPKPLCYWFALLMLLNFTIFMACEIVYLHPYFAYAPYKSIGRWARFGVDLITAAGAMLTYLIYGHHRLIYGHHQALAEWFYFAFLIIITLQWHALGQVMHVDDVNVWDMLFGIAMQLLIFSAARHDNPYLTAAALSLCFALISYRCWFYTTPLLLPTLDVARFDLKKRMIIPTIES